ncbi:MAG TPA: HD-GYP domain-containing protein [Kosmotogaceae bacterium]|nr:HD-GYP domain-containing protein [Kosmotogaceae bacterium]
MKGFKICEEGSSIEKVCQKSGTLSLVAKGGSIEVLVQELRAGTRFFVQPGDSDDLMEFFRVIKGCLEVSDGKGTLIKPGDSFYAYRLEESVSLLTLEDTELLYVCSQPVFQYISRQIKELKELLEKVEAKDVYTHSHGKRVRDLAFAVGEKLGLSGNRLENLAFAGFFHDIGKAGVPESILKKPGALTTEEFRIIMTHAQKGAEMVEGTLLEGTARIIEQHHERSDGSGYPKGLKEDETTLEARILAVVDSYDAMTSDRPYRSAMSPRQAIDELVSLAGVKYNAQVVEALKQSLIEIGEL